MTIFGWDASHYDWGRGPMDIAAAARDGISWMTHKIGEARTVVDARFDDWYKRARGVIPLLGAYYVAHPGDQKYQADRFLSLLDDRAPGWRDGPFLLQVDAERFDYMDREPSPAEIKAFCDRLVSRTKGNYRPVVYAPRWLYHDRLEGLGYPLWASDYDDNPAVHYRKAYPGDKSDRWAAYSTQTPAILQYGSMTKIGRQPRCDANAFRGGLAQLTSLVYPKGDGMTVEEIFARLVGWRGSDQDGMADKIRFDTAIHYIGNDAYRAWQFAEQCLAEVKKLSAMVAELKSRPPVDVDQLATSIVAKLPPTALTEDEVRDAVKDALREGTGQ